MKHWHARILTFVLAALTLSSLLFCAPGLAFKSAAQDQAKSVDIQGYKDQPVELVDIRIGSNSIKSGMTRVSQYPDWFVDNVKFNAAPDWHKDVSLTVKNVSGKPVIGVSGHIFFKAAGTGDLFGMQFFQELDLQKTPLAPGAETNLVVNPRTWERIMNIIKQKGADPNLAAISLEVDSVMFTEDTQWSKGAMLRRDPDSPNRWLGVLCKRKQ